MIYTDKNYISNEDDNIVRVRSTCGVGMGQIALLVLYQRRFFASGKHGKPDSWFLCNSYKRKQNLIIDVQKPVPEKLHISHQNYKILHRNI